MAIVGTDLSLAIRLLEQGELVAIPTETVYGLAANALQPESVARIFEVKERPTFDPLIVHVPDLKNAFKYVLEFPPMARQLAERFWPGPLTLLLPKKPLIPDLVTSGLDTVGIRCPNHPLTSRLLALLPFPLAAPSANPFGYVSPTLPEHVNDQLGSRIKYILDGGPCSIGLESTIVGFEEEQPVVYRLGGLSLDDIVETIGPVRVHLHSSSNPKAPGQLKSHYAPMKKVVAGVLSALLQQHGHSRVGLLSFHKDYHFAHQVILSPQGNLNEASRNLFSALREMDKMPIDMILAEWVPDTGLGRAINDRLNRAAAQRD